MDLRDSPDEAAFRESVRAWLRDNLPAEPGRDWSRKLFDAGYAGLTWPEEYGGRAAPYNHQAIVLEAGVGRVIEGVLLGLAGVAVVGVLTIVLQRKLPHKRMLELTGLMILAVLAIMVGKTIQVFQVVGWLPVDPIDGVQLPYWAGAWFGVFPTWEGVAAQLAAVALVLGSYVGAEAIRRSRRRKIMTAPVAAPTRAAPEPAEPEPELERVPVESAR